MIHYTIVFNGGEPITDILGVELDGDSLYFWFEPSRIRTCFVLLPGDTFTVTRTV